MMRLLSENFFIHPVCIVPALLLLILSMLKVHVILAMGSTVIVSMIFAMAAQGASLSSLAACAVSGYQFSIGIAVVDDILSRGGIAANVGSVTIVFFLPLWLPRCRQAVSWRYSRPCFCAVFDPQRA